MARSLGCQTELNADPGGPLCAIRQVLAETIEQSIIYAGEWERAEKKLFTDPGSYRPGMFCS
jgi:hypothetical protein